MVETGRIAEVASRILWMTVIVKSYTYNAYGNTSTSGAFVNSFAYTGAVSDPETGLYYMNARYYDPSTGCFISQDSYRGDGEAFWQLYAYCDGDPVNNVDATGHKSVVYYTKTLKQKKKMWAAIAPEYYYVQMTIKYHFIVKNSRGVVRQIDRIEGDLWTYMVDGGVAIKAFQINWMSVGGKKYWAKDMKNQHVVIPKSVTHYSYKYVNPKSLQVSGYNLKFSMNYWVDPTGGDTVPALPLYGGTTTMIY